MLRDYYLLREHGSLVNVTKSKSIHVLISKNCLANWLLLLLAEWPSSLSKITRWLSILLAIVVQDLKQAARAIIVSIMDRRD